MKFGFSDFAYFSDIPEGKSKRDILQHLLDSGIKDLRFGANLIQLPSKNKYGDMNLLKSDLKYYQSLGFRLHIYFFFSDDISNAGRSLCPEAWNGKDLEEISGLLGEDCRQYLDFFKNEGIKIDTYTLGNEVEFGVCGYRLDDRVSSKGYKGDRDFKWLTENLWYANSILLKAVSKAVREKDPGAKIIIHSDSIARYRFTYMLFKAMADAGVDYDVIGLTYCPWTIWDDDLHGFRKISEAVQELKKLNKPIWMLEYCYPKEIIDNGELTDTPPDARYPFNVVGQTAFHVSFIKACEQLGVDMIYFWRGEHRKASGDISWKTGILEDGRIPGELLRYIKE